MEHDLHNTDRKDEGAKSTMQRRAEVKLSVLFDLVRADYKDNGYKGAILEANLKHLMPYFASRSAERVKEHDVEEYKRIRRSTENASPNTIQLELNTLGRAYTLGVEKKYIRSRPRIVRYPKKVLDKSIRKGFFEHEQYQQLLANCKPYQADCLTFTYFCGWRSDEVFNLTWADNYVDDPPHIRIYDSKNDRGRVLPLLDDNDRPTELYRVIQRRLADKRADCPYIFHYEGRPLNRSTFNKHWRAACKDSGVTRYFHDLRRTANRNLKNSGVDQQDRMMIIGHRTPSMDERYGITNEQDLKVALGKVFRGMSKRKPLKSKETATSDKTGENTSQECVSEAPAQTGENTEKVAERSGFEPENQVNDYTLSRRISISKSVRSFLNLFMGTVKSRK